MVRGAEQSLSFDINYRFTFNMLESEYVLVKEVIFNEYECNEKDVIVDTVATHALQLCRRPHKG